MATDTREQIISKRQHNLANEFMPKRFMSMLNTELQKIDPALSFQITNKDNWKITTITKTNYFWFSWFEDRENEIMVCVDAVGPIFYNGVQIGPEVAFRYTFKNNCFEDLNQIVQDILKLRKTNISNVPSSVNINNFTDDFVNENLDEIIDLIAALEKPLEVMGYSPSKAHKMAVSIIDKYPNIKNIDELLEKVHEG